MSASLVTRIAARIDAAFDVPADVRDAAAEELATIARGKKMSAAKLSAQVIEDTLYEYMPAEDDEEQEAIEYAEEAEAAIEDPEIHDYEEDPSDLDLMQDAHESDPEPVFRGDYEDDASNVVALRRLSDNLTPADDSPKVTTHTKAVRDAATTSAPRKGAHADCDHESSKAARAKCRRERARAASDHKDA